MNTRHLAKSWVMVYLMLVAASPCLAAQSDRSGIRLPLSFVENVGQWQESIAYGTAGGLYQVSLSPDRVTLPIGNAEEGKGTLELVFEGANTLAKAAPSGMRAGRSAYIRGANPDDWKTGVPHFAQVRFEEVYPGIDLVYLGEDGRLRYDFHVHPGASFEDIRLRFEGAEKIALGEDGRLHVVIDGKELIQRAPYVFQEVNGSRQRLEAGYRIGEHGKVGFSVENALANTVLVIDPVIEYASYLGGTGDFVSATPWGIEVASDGNIVIVGTTNAWDFPLKSPLDSVGDSAADITVTRLDPVTNTLIYSTYIGGTGNEGLSVLALDSQDRVVVGATTDAADFPLLNAIQSDPSESVLFRLAADGQSLDFSTYWGGGVPPAINTSFFGTRIRGLETDSQDRIVIVGQTGWTDFPATGSFVGHSCLEPFEDQNTDRVEDLYFARFTSSGALEFAYCIGSNVFLSEFNRSAIVRGRGLAIDPSDNLFVVGYSETDNIPLANAWQSTRAGPRDIVVYKISGSDQSILYGSFFGGSSTELPAAIEVLGDGSFIVSGTTYSSDFPMVNPFKSTFEGGEEPFVFRAKTDGTGPIFSTYAGTDEIRDGVSYGVDALVNLGADAQDRIFFIVTSSAASADLLKPFQNAPADPEVLDPDDPPVDCLATSISKTGEIIYRSWLGGSDSERCAYFDALDVTANGTVWFAAQTGSMDVPLRRGFDESPLGSGESKYYIGKISPRDPVRALAAVPSFTGGPAAEIEALLETDGSSPNTVFRTDVEKSAELGGSAFQDEAHFPIDLVAVGTDVGGGAASDVAVLSRTVTGDNRVQVRDADTGGFVRNITFFNSDWKAIDFARADPVAGGTDPVLAVLARNTTTDEIAVQVRNAATGAFVKNVFFLNSNWTPLQLVIVPETDGNAGPEIGVLATTDAGQIVISVKDGGTNAFIRNVFFLNSNWRPVDAIALEGVTGAAGAVLGLLAQNTSTGKLVVMLKEAGTNTFVRNVFPLSSAWDPVGLTVVPNYGGGTASPEVGVLGASATGKLAFQVRDSGDAGFVDNVFPLGSGWQVADMEAAGDVDNDGLPDLSVLAFRLSDSSVVIHTRTIDDDSLIGNVFLP